MRILPDDQLVAVEVAKYDRKIVLEALHNCIAHQDYGRNGRIVVTELPDRLLLENEGNFFEGRPEDYIAGARTPRRYRNPFLAQAMAELNMIDTMGYGIHEMHVGQARRYFPMPDYDLSEPQAVKMTIHGRVVDPAYSRLLIQKTDLPLEDILALDRIQKKLPLNDEGVLRHLRKAGLIEGRNARRRAPALRASRSFAPDEARAGARPPPCRAIAGWRGRTGRRGSAGHGRERRRPTSSAAKRLAYFRAKDSRARASASASRWASVAPGTACADQSALPV